MKKLLLVLALAATVGQLSAQGVWKKSSAQNLSASSKVYRVSEPSEFETFSLDLNVLKTRLQGAQERNVAGAQGIVVQFPNELGEVKNYRVFESSVMEPGLAERYPELKSYTGYNIDTPSETVRFSVTMMGLNAMMFTERGSVFIDPYTQDRSTYIVYNKKSLAPRPFECHVEDADPTVDLGRSNATALASDGQYRVYRLAMACTIEYAAFHIAAAGVGAGTEAQKKAAVLSAMVVSMTRINGVYEREMAIHMNLVSNNDAVIFVNTDTFSNDDASQLINQSQTVINNIIGAANYDIGHTVSTGGGGLAQLACVCGPSKARGITGSPAPVGDAYDIDYVAHEMGHQFGANHTFNGNGGSCTGNRNDPTAVEPGGGTTIMAYAGICEASDIQPNSNDYFHAVSIGEISAFVAGAGGTCAVTTANGNAAPVVNAGSDYTIPKGTAFILKGSATDTNQAALTYCWEQTNNTVSTQPPLATATSGPNYRSVSPSTSPNRYMPNFASVLAGNLTPKWEVTPSVPRPLNFALTVRDNASPNGGQTGRDDMVVNVANVGPFQITSPNVENVTWTQNTPQTITWDVAGTTANGINTANVNILFSSDAGATWTTLVNNTPNDGSEAITVPNVAAPFCRIMVEAVGNIFYAVSKSFAIGYIVESTNTCTTYTTTPATPIAGQAQPAWSVVGQVTIPADQTGIITDLNVSVNITHPRINDLYVGIHPPGPLAVGSIRILYQQSCGTLFSAGMNTTFSDGSPSIVCTQIANGNTYSPVNSLDIYNGMQPAGQWRLVVADLTVPNSGTLNSFSVNVCSTTTTVTLATDNFHLADFSLYPNPNRGNFNVKFTPDGQNAVNVFVHDIQGRKIFDKAFPASGLFEENLQLSSVQSGIYLVTVENGNKKEVKRIVVE